MSPPRSSDAAGVADVPGNSPQDQLVLAAIVASSDDAILGTDLNGIITSWNGAAERIFGYSAGEAVGQSILLIVPSELHTEEEAVIARVREGTGVDHYETTRRTKSGRLVQISLTVSLIRTAGGTLIGAWQIARDTTLTKRFERDARHFAAIVASSDDAIISKDLEGTVLTWNKSAERLFGYAASEIVGRSIRLIVPSDRQAEEDHVLASIRAGRTIEHFETIRRRKDGSPIPISLTVSPIRDAAGTIVGASKIARDLTRTERVQREAFRLAAIVDSSDDAIIGKDLDSIVTSWNAAAERIFGYAAAEIIGRSIRVLIPDDRQHEEDDVLRRIRNGQRLEHYETLRRRKDGTVFPVSLTISPIRNQHGVVIGASKIARDVTDRLRADDERQRLLDNARSANHLKDEFLATLSHELRTPLNAIVGYTRMMQSGLLSAEKQGRAVDTVVRNATSLTQIVEDILDISRIVSGKVRLNVQPVELSQLVREVAETSQPAADAKGIGLEVIAEPDGTLVSGDPDRIRQVLWNLCSNAVKFSARGGRVQLRLERVNSQVEITVSDNGMGIAAEFLPHLFERFSQADQGSSRLHSGLGLGLAISRHLIELQGGRISAHSAGPGRGATFRVELPVRSVAAGDDGGRRHPAAPRDLGVPRIPQLNGVRILVVDDDRDALALSREILETTGASVTTAESAAEALEKLHHGTADVLIADLGMPRMDGFELIQRVRVSDDVAVRAIPAGALTAFARSEDRIRAMQSGFEVHLSKPIEPAELMAAAATLARRRR
jgi:PAS domain S-box-containing protein